MNRQIAYEEDTLQRMPPQNLEAEGAVLGAIMLENTSIDKALEVIQPDDFYRPAHRTIFKAMIELADHGDVIDLVTLPEILRRKEELERSGGLSYISSLLSCTPNAANIAYHCKIVFEKAVLRGMIAAATDIVSRGYDDTRDVDSFVDDAQRSISEVAERKIGQSNDFINITSACKEAFEHLEYRYKQKDPVMGISTGFPQMDIILSGLCAGDLVIVAGLPSMGKTAFALNIASNVAIGQSIPTAVFSMEMKEKGRHQLSLRMMSFIAKVDSQRMRSGQLLDSDWGKLTEAAGTMSGKPLFINDTAALKPSQIKILARKIKREHGLGLIIADYLQLMRPDNESKSEQAAIADITRSMKAIAMELDCASILLSQLNREIYKREARKPVLADLRGSGAIEQDADVVIFPWRPAMMDKSKSLSEASAIIAKQRNGPVNDEIPMVYTPEFTLFTEKDTGFPQTGLF